eukprot:2452152-Ditylum_brightwellii.AAC.1
MAKDTSTSGSNHYCWLEDEQVVKARFGEAGEDTAAATLMSISLAVMGVVASVGVGGDRSVGSNYLTGEIC